MTQDNGDTVYLNGRWLRRAEAAVSVEDRGFLFADGVYEVVRYYHGRPLAMDQHVRRMNRSMRAIRIRLPDDHPPLGALSDDLVRRNGLLDAAAYWQVTRGAARRRHQFPPPDIPPTVLIMAYPAVPMDTAAPPATLRAITRPDVRWHCCSIKSIALLANVLDSQAAADAGCDEAILVRDGIVTEGTQRSILIAEGGRLTTYPLDGRILDSITRRIVLDLANDAGIDVREEPCDTARLFAADEVIAVGSTTEVAAVTHIDDRPIARAQPGPVTTRLLHLYRQHVATQCGR